MSDEVKSMGSASADTALDNGSGAPTADHASTIDGNDDAIVLRRKKPIAGWRLAVIFAWYDDLPFPTKAVMLTLVPQKQHRHGLVPLAARRHRRRHHARRHFRRVSGFQNLVLGRPGLYPHRSRYVFPPLTSKTLDSLLLTDLLTGFAVAMARLSDALGRKTIVCTSFAIFLAASMGCGASANLDQLIGFRAAQGVGGAGLYSMAMITYPELSPPNRVVLVTSALGAIVALAGVCGPVIGGLLTTYVGWRYVFWIK